MWVLDIWPDSLVGGGVRSKLVILSLKNLRNYLFGCRYSFPKFEWVQT